MRIQVRIGEQYKELQEHLEPLKPDVRGKRLLALAIMQLAAMKVGSPSVVNACEQSIAEELQVKPEPTDKKPKKRAAPSWIKENAAT